MTRCTTKGGFFLRSAQRRLVDSFDFLDIIFGYSNVASMTSTRNVDVPRDARISDTNTYHGRESSPLVALDHLHRARANPTKDVHRARATRAEPPRGAVRLAVHLVRVLVLALAETTSACAPFLFALGSPARLARTRLGASPFANLSLACIT